MSNVRMLKWRSARDHDSLTAEDIQRHSGFYREIEIAAITGETAAQQPMPSRRQENTKGKASQRTTFPLLNLLLATAKPAPSN